ncbi:MAG: ATP-binding protein [Actinophytocola sp.]|nr:ATP-binding protein [Actinophytocola sp.]
MFSASSSYTLQPRAAQLCRVLLRVRLVIALFALLLLATNPLSARFIVAFLGAFVTSLLAYVFWRRIARVLQRHPILTGLDVVVLFVVLGLGGSLTPFLLLTITTSAIAGLLYRWWGVLYISTLQVSCYFTVVAFQTGAADVWNFQTIVSQPLYYPLAGFLGVWIRRLLDETASTEQARREAEVATAAAEERARLAREMHDSLAKTVRGIEFAASALPNWVERDPARASTEARRIASAAAIASREARDLLSELRAAADGVERPLVPTVTSMVTEWSERTGVPVDLTTTDDVDLPARTRYETTAILAEALANVERHAEASRVQVALQRANDMLQLTVTDDGRGFNGERRDELVAEGHFGLLGMSERANRSGGSMTLRARPGAGTTVAVTIQLTPQVSATGEQTPVPADRRAHHPGEAR